MKIKKLHEKAILLKYASDECRAFPLSLKRMESKQLPSKKDVIKKYNKLVKNYFKGELSE